MLRPIAGTDGEAFLRAKGFDPDATDVLRYRDKPPAVVVPMVNDVGVPHGAQLIEIRPKGRGWDCSLKLLVERRNLMMRLRPWRSGPLVIASGPLDALAYATLHRERAVWALPLGQDRSRITLPQGVERVILTATTGDDAAAALGQAQMLASLGVTATVEIALAEEWPAACRGEVQRAKTLERWGREKPDAPAGPTFRPDGWSYSFQHGWRRRDG